MHNEAASLSIAGSTEVSHTTHRLLRSRNYIWSKTPRLEMVFSFPSWLGIGAEKDELKITQMNKCILEITKGCFLSSYCKYPSVTYNPRARGARVCSPACLHLHDVLLQKEILPSRPIWSCHRNPARAEGDEEHSSPSEPSQRDGRFIIKEHLHFCSVARRTMRVFAGWTPGLLEYKGCPWNKRMLWLL